MTSKVLSGRSAGGTTSWPSPPPCLASAAAVGTIRPLLSWTRPGRTIRGCRSATDQGCRTAEPERLVRKRAATFGLSPKSAAVACAGGVIYGSRRLDGFGSNLVAEAVGVGLGI